MKCKTKEKWKRQRHNWERMCVCVCACRCVCVCEWERESEKGYCVPITMEVMTSRLIRLCPGHIVGWKFWLCFGYFLRKCRKRKKNIKSGYFFPQIFCELSNTFFMTESADSLIHSTNIKFHCYYRHLNTARKRDTLDLLKRTITSRKVEG